MVIGIWVSFLIIVVLRKVVAIVVLRCLCCDDKAECWGHSWYLLLWEVFMATVVWRCFLVQMPWRESWVLFVILVILKNIVFMVSSGVFGAFTQKNEWFSIWGISIFGHCGLKVSLVHWHSRMMSSFQGISILWPPWFTASLVEWFKRDDELISYDFTLLCHCLGSCPAPFCMISPIGLLIWEDW